MTHRETVVPNIGSVSEERALCVADVFTCYGRVKDGNWLLTVGVLTAMKMVSWSSGREICITIGTTRAHDSRRHAEYRHCWQTVVLLLNST